MKSILCFLLSVFVAAISVTAQPGALDLTFDPGDGADNAVNAIVLQPDGKILIGGAFTTFNGVSRNGIARLNGDGSLDASFNPSFGFGGGAVKCLAVQTDGKVVVSGEFATFNGVGRNGFARLNADGSLDAAFNPGVYSSGGGALDIAIQSDGKLLFAASMSDGVSNMGQVSRTNGDGSLDATFAPASFGVGDIFSCVEVLPDGKIIIAGRKTNFAALTAEACVYRLNTSGILDGTFDAGLGGVDAGFLRTSVIDCAVLESGEIILAGRFDTFDGIQKRAIVRLLANGSVDVDFTTTVLTGSTARSLAVQSNGKIVASFNEDQWGSVLNDMTRFAPEGTSDVAFDSATEVVNVYDIALQPDGKILIAGDFAAYNNIPRSRIARLTGDPDGVGFSEVDRCALDNMTLTPNPFRGGGLRVHLGSVEPSLASIQFVDLMGKVVLEQSSVLSSPSKGRVEVTIEDLTRLTPGIYVVVVTTARQQFSQRLVVECGRP